MIGLGLLVVTGGACELVDELVSGDAGAPAATEGTTPAGAVDAGGGPVTVEATELPFLPSNLPVEVDVRVSDDLVLAGDTCGTSARISTDEGTITCDERDKTPYFAFATFTQANGSEVAVFAARRIVISQTMQVAVHGQRPLLLLGREDVDIRGSLRVAADRTEGRAGGFNTTLTESSPGNGPGGGGAGRTNGIGGGGAGHCGTGGPGAAADPSSGQGGQPYGTPEIVPLVGGSSGGSAARKESGAGGGAVQVVSGTKITVRDTGVIHAGGGEGFWYTTASGGGSGGSILLEAPVVEMGGLLAANGGGGGGGGTFGDDGTPAQAAATSAPGGKGGGGAGGAGASADGQAGTDGSGGGGATGRIRINTLTASASITGTLSPALTTPCTTQGPTAPLP